MRESSPSRTAGSLAITVLSLLLVWLPAMASAQVEFDPISLKKTKFKPPKKPATESSSAKEVFKAKFLAKGAITLGVGNDGIDLPSRASKSLSGSSRR